MEYFVQYTTCTVYTTYRWLPQKSSPTAKQPNFNHTHSTTLQHTFQQPTHSQYQNQQCPQSPKTRLMTNAKLPEKSSISFRRSPICWCVLHPPRTVVDRIWIHLGLLFHIIHHYLTPLQDKKIKLYNIIPKTDMSNRIPTWTGQSCRFVCLSLKTGSTPMLWRYAFPHEIIALHASFGVKVTK